MNRKVWLLQEINRLIDKSHTEELSEVDKVFLDADKEEDTINYNKNKLNINIIDYVNLDADKLYDVGKVLRNIKSNLGRGSQKGSPR